MDVAFLEFFEIYFILNRGKIFSHGNSYGWKFEHEKRGKKRLQNHHYIAAPQHQYFLFFTS